MENNRLLTIYTARSRREAVLQAAPMNVAALFARLSSSQTLPMAHDAYMNLKKPQQDDLKDVGAYIAGELKGGRRRAGCVLSRSAAVLDADGLPAGGTEDFIRRVAALGVCCCVHSTAKHSAAIPRMRAVIPFAQDIPAEQYAPIVRLLCRMIQLELTWFDPTCDRPGQIMYNPTHCQDVEPIWFVQDKPLLDAVALLERDLPAWCDPRSWPQFPREVAPAKLAAKQEDPTAKTGVVGAFCRAYDVPAAMAKFLPGVYEETATEGRYTFTGGSTWGGAVLYDNGKFLFSHHATDPAGGRLVNAFDLVRLHRFGELDDEAKDGTPTGRLPSWSAMVELAREDSIVLNEIAREAFSKAGAKEELIRDEDATLALGRCAGVTLSLEVVKVALRAFGIRVRRNLVTGKTEISGLAPRYSLEESVNALPVFLMDKLRAIGVKGVSKTTIADYLFNILEENRYNPVLEMLDNTVWDRESRFPDLLRILDIPVNSFYATLVRKWLIQTVAVAHNETGAISAGEGVLTLQGPQRIGKTWFFRRLAIRDDWFAEGVTLDLRNKDSRIQATGAWITELGELDSTILIGNSGLKAFITLKVDSIRAPYAREKTDRPRRTSFCATVNPETFLVDETGDYRYWVIPVDKIALRMLEELPESWFVQVWAEAADWWRATPQGFRLTAAEKENLNNLNQQHRAPLRGEEEIRQALNWDLPQGEWGQFTATDIKKQLFPTDPRLTTQQIGKVLARLEREESEVTCKADSRSRVKTYTLPLKKLFSVIADTAETHSITP